MEAFIRRLVRQPKIKAAMNEMLLHPNLACSYLERAEELFYQPAEDGYLNANDTAVAAYIFLIARSPDPDIQNFIRMAAMSHRPDLRWTPLLAKRYAGRVAGISVRDSSDQGVGGVLFVSTGSIARQEPAAKRVLKPTGLAAISIGGY